MDIRRERFPAALTGKAFAAERRLAGLRLAVVACNLILYLAFVAGRPETKPVLAMVIIGFGIAYSI